MGFLCSGLYVTKKGIDKVSIYIGRKQKTVLAAVFLVAKLDNKILGLLKGLGVSAQGFARVKLGQNGRI